MEVLEGTVLLDVLAGDGLNGGGHEEILLLQPQGLALVVVVLGVEHLTDGVGHGALLGGVEVLALAEELHIDGLGAAGLPQTQGVHMVGVVAGDLHIAGDGQHTGVVLMDHHQVVVVPAGADLTAEADLLGLLQLGQQPRVAQLHPVVGKLHLLALHDLLLENAQLIADGVARRRDLQGGHAVQIAGGQAAQTAVAQARIGLLLIDGVDLDVGISQHALGNLVQAKVEQAGAQAAAHQELHAEVVDLLLALAQDLGLELLLTVGHDLAGDHGQAAVDLVSGGGVDGDVALTHQLVLEQLLKFTLCVFQNRSLLLCSHENS